MVQVLCFQPFTGTYNIDSTSLSLEHSILSVPASPWDILYWVNKYLPGTLSVPASPNLFILLQLISLYTSGLWAVLPEVYGKPAYSANLETFLRKELFNTYEVLQRPQNQMFISMSLTILTVNDMVMITN